MPALTLIGHTNNVCALAVGVHPATGRPVLVSGSWDMTARVWDLATAQSVQTLQGHTMAVWAVAFLENGDIATASADKTVRIWRDGHTVRTLTAHTDCIRALAVVPGLGVLSAANDATLILWSGDGECLQTFHGHTAYVYAVALLPDGDVVSTGEDRSLRVWHNGECVQTILHPADSIWSVATLANGDVATAANDGVVRVFSRDPARFAPEAVAQAFDAAVSAHAIPAEAMDLDPSTVAGPEALGQPGKKAGEVKMVRNGGVIEAYQWNGETFQWDKVGVVTEVRQQSKKLYNGAEYDFVFDVDLEDGGPPRKLPYNLDENPYMAAQNFIHREEISQSALDTIARFIIDNTKHARRAPAAPQPTANAAPFHSTVAEGWRPLPFADDSAHVVGARVYVAPPLVHTSSRSVHVGGGAGRGRRRRAGAAYAADVQPAALAHEPAAEAGLRRDGRRQRARHRQEAGRAQRAAGGRRPAVGGGAAERPAGRRDGRKHLALPRHLALPQPDYRAAARSALAVRPPLPRCVASKASVQLANMMC